MSQKKAHKENLKWFVLCLVCLFAAFFVAKVKADDGYRLWLRYDQLSSRRVKSVAVEGNSATFDLIRGELSHVKVDDRDGPAVVVGLPQTSTLIRKLQWDSELKKL